MAKPDLELGADEVLEGRLVYNGGLHVHGGRLQGDISCAGDIAIDQGSSVEARLTGENLTIRSDLTGGASARGRLEVSAGAAVSGDIEAARLVVEEGATLNGRVTMNSK